MVWSSFCSNSHSRKWKNKSAQTKWQWNVPQTTSKLAQFCANGICLAEFWRDFRWMFSLSVRSFSISISSKNFHAFPHQLPLCWWEFLLSKHKLHAISLTALFCSWKLMESSETKKICGRRSLIKPKIYICLIACWCFTVIYRNSFVWNKRKDTGRCPYQVWNLTFLLLLTGPFRSVWAGEIGNNDISCGNGDHKLHSWNEWSYSNEAGRKKFLINC